MATHSHVLDLEPAASAATASGEPASETPAADACRLIERAVAFTLAGQRYALPLDDVQEVQHIVALAEAEFGGAVVGMLNLRGAVIPAIDLRRLFGEPAVPYTLQTPMVICRSEQGLVVLIADQVDDVLMLHEGCVQAVSPLHALASMMLGVASFDSGLVYVLDLDAILARVGREVSDDL